MGYSRKIQMEFYGISKNIKEKMWKFQRRIKKGVEFPGKLKKKSCGISMGLGFRLWNFQKSISSTPVWFLSGIAQCDIFLFMFYVLHLVILNLTGVSKINPQWKCLLALNEAIEIF